MERAVAERHALERDLHDSVQQQLLALALDLRLALVERDPLPPQAEALSQALRSVQQAFDDVRAISHGVSPPLLATRGLGAAVASMVRRLGSAGQARQAPVRPLPPSGGGSRVRGRGRSADAWCRLAAGSSPQAAPWSYARKGPARVWTACCRTWSPPSVVRSTSPGQRSKRCSRAHSHRGRPAADARGHGPDPCRGRCGRGRGGRGRRSPAPSGGAGPARRALVDIRLPPTHTDEGLRAADRIRSEYPATAVLIVSSYVRPTTSRRSSLAVPAESATCSRSESLTSRRSSTG